MKLHKLVVIGNTSKEVSPLQPLIITTFRKVLKQKKTNNRAGYKVSSLFFKEQTIEYSAAKKRHDA